MIIAEFPVNNSSAKDLNIKRSVREDIDTEIDGSAKGLLILTGCFEGQKFSNEDADTRGLANEDKYSIIKEMIYLIRVIYPDALILRI